MPTIKIEVQNKIALSPAEHIVCGNSDYKIEFAFDSEWEAYATKTARFSWNGEVADVIFDGSVCPVPPLTNATVCEVGVYAGDLHTTTPALVTCRKSILCKGGLPADPLPDVYAQLLEKLNSLDPSGAGGGCHITHVESMDKDNMLSLRDLESGLYILYGYFKPFAGCSSTLIIDNGFYMVGRVDEGSHLLSISPLNFRMTCHEILVDDTADGGHTYRNFRVNLEDVNGAVEKIKDLVIPSVVSAFENDAGYLTEVPEGYAKTEDIPATLPNPYKLKISPKLEQASGSVIMQTFTYDGTEAVSLGFTIPYVPKVLSAFTNDSGYQTEAEVTALINTALGVIENGTY